MKVRLTLTGYAPLLMHSDRLADPLDEATVGLRKITSKRKKTEEDQHEIARLEWRGSLYWSPEVGPYIPGRNIQKSLIEGARISRMGRQIERGVFVESNEAPLTYDGPRDPDAMWESGRFSDRRTVKVTTSRTVRTRPIFNEWSCAADVELDTSQMGLDDFRRVAEESGRLVGLGDFRPRYGRFTVSVEEVRGQ